MSLKFIEARVVGRSDHTPTLFSLQFDAQLDTFKAGQFCRVGLRLPSTEPGCEPTLRAYSLVNAPDERPHEIIITVVDAESGGVLSPHLHALKVGDPLCVSARTNGFFTMPEVPPADVLWGLSTGTAIGPFLSFMKTDAPWQKFARIVFVHAVRMAAELVYQDQISDLARRYGERFQYIPMVSREPHSSALSGRIPAAISNGSLEARAGIALTALTAHCMLCGNPDMVKDTMTVLQARGLRKHRPTQAGQITVEAYW
jgi:ferredoxin/flavodoxin---NADP+ reductase